MGRGSPLTGGGGVVFESSIVDILKYTVSDNKEFECVYT